ncbi:MAG: response regulator [Bacteroidales bacterium]|nr:response regulator [Bacteroidales bacterium]
MPDRVPDSVLIVEDDAGVATLQKRRLERSGYRVQWSPTASAARQQLADQPYDLLLLDYRIPDVSDGISFYRELTASGVAIAAVMVTGLAEERVIIDALRAGIRDFVTKSPAYLDYLPEAVGRVMEQERNARERRRAEAALREAHRVQENILGELRATTQQLWQAAKLATVGELAASVAHEINNPLGIVSLRLEGILAATPENDPRRPALQIIEAEVDRMAKLIANLLTFSRRGDDQLSTVDLGDEARMSAELADYHLRRRGVVKVFDIPSAVPPVYADRQKFRQVFLNLYTNAVDAMPHGGTITTRVRGEASADGPIVIVEVVDTGFGIPSAILPHVMDTFFTTKSEGHGTGLGLAICRRIIQEHKGELAITSNVGQGTTVRLTLPTNEANERIS